MRLKITFGVETRSGAKGYLPLLYRHRFMALIKEALSNSDNDYKRKIYPDKDSKHSERVKPFAFSICPPPFNFDLCPVEDFEITVSNPNKSARPPRVRDRVIPIRPNEHISMFISSSDYEFILSVYNGLLSMKEFMFNDEIKFTLQKVFVLNEKRIVSDEVVFKTLSPVLLEKQEIQNGRKRDISILPPMEEGITDEEFNMLFTSIHKGILKDITGEGLKEGQPFEFTPLKIRKQVVKHTVRAFWERNPNNPVMKFTCFEGCFKLKGDPRDLQLLYQIGIGLRTGQGFGMVDVV